MRYSRLPSTMGTRIHGLPRWIVFVGAFASALTTGSVGLAGEPGAGSPVNFVLHLADGGFVAGKFRETDRSGMIRWQGNAFTSPFDFNLKSIDTMQAPVPTQLASPEGAFRIELSGGDVVFGTLVALDDKEAELDLPRIGRLRIQRSHLLRLERWQDHADLVYLGPTGLVGWTPSPVGGPKAWREESGALMTDQEGASITSDIPLPARAVIEFELSWKNQPDFVLTLGAAGLRGVDEKKEENPFRFEVWEQELVVQRETPKEADVASLGKLDAGPGRVHLRVYFDDERGRLIVDAPDGKPLAELNVAASKPHVLAGFQLENKKGDVRLERLEVTRWSGELLREPLPDGPNLRRTDGSNLSAKGIQFNAESKSFVVSKGDNESRIPLDETACLTFSHLTEIPARPVNILLQEGSRLSGDLVGVEKGALVLKIPGGEEPVRLPIDLLRSLVANHSQDASVEDPKFAPRLEMDGVRLIGRLIDGKSESGVSCLTWQPNGSATASTILAGSASGRILYKEPAPAIVTAPRVTTIREGNRVQVFNGPVVIQQIPPPQPAAPQGGLQGFIMAFAGAAQGRPAVANPTKADVGADTAAPGRRALYLRTGDIIPAEIIKIDEKGLTIRTSHSKDAFVPHEKIKAVELSEEPIIPVRLNKAKRERLLTLPRVQKGSPPTHLIRSKNGDYLRGRVVGMDEKSLQVEVRLEVKTLPRDRVARIIWLQSEDLEAGKGPASQQQEPAKNDEELLVQALRKDGVRLTFIPDRFEGDTFTGTSRVLGECRVRLDEVDQLLIGKAIEKEAAQLTFQRWLLTDAPEPKVTEDDGGGTSGGGGSSGLSSPLVGKPAPDFSLEQLGGKTFSLADAKGKVVVLDFWATWCGPCLQAMPQVEKVTGEFRDQGVMLVAVNLQESPQEISAMLERHKLNLTVALDKDGAVAEKYKANAIPQTVVIDREGNVTRLFVGGGPHLGDQLREAIQATLGGPDAKKAPVSGGTDPKEPAK